MPIVSTGRTTPDPAVLHAGLQRMREAGFAACAIEATSIGIVEQRLVGVQVAVALFTNFTRDHLDYHGSMDSYWAAKQKLFAWPGLKAAVINLDDAQGESLAPTLADHLDVWSYSLQRDDARLRARALHYVDGGLAFTLHQGAQALPVRSQLIGDYNAANLLAVIGGLLALGVPLADAVAAVPHLTPVPGRMQKVNDGRSQPLVVVDYAHTPDALEKALIALRPLAAARGGRLVCVFGCGGNRDASKRAPMGAIAERLADALVLTSDNPRHEAPAAILQGIVTGLGQPSRVQVIEDRRAAIEQAVRDASASDVLLIAGKGHEDYQETAGVKLPFSDVDEAQRGLAARGPAP
jgi:UDP-N-acetylmuramoyl-L-alanyl-D-glutamate--2,6-diaminopimelate ligase